MPFFLECRRQGVGFLVLAVVIFAAAGLRFYKPFIQQSWLFSLWLLHCRGAEQRDLAFYEDNYLRAFPMLLDRVEGSAYESKERVINGAYASCIFHQFPVLFGLVDCIKHDPEDILSDYSVKATPLFSRLVTFSV